MYILIVSQYKELAFESSTVDYETRTICENIDITEKRGGITCRRDEHANHELQERQKAFVRWLPFSLSLFNEALFSRGTAWEGRHSWVGQAPQKSSPARPFRSPKSGAEWKRQTRRRVNKHERSRFFVDPSQIGGKFEPDNGQHAHFPSDSKVQQF